MQDQRVFSAKKLRGKGLNLEKGVRLYRLRDRKMQGSGRFVNYFFQKCCGRSQGKPQSSTFKLDIAV